jgi:hypothetical protein
MGTVNKRRSLIAGLMLALAFAGVAPAQSPGDASPPPIPTREEPTVLQQAGDLLVLRPLLAVRLVVSVATLPLAWPTAALLGDSDWALEVCVREPAERLFGRPIGRL